MCAGAPRCVPMPRGVCRGSGALGERAFRRGVGGRCASRRPLAARRPRPG
jgi:hypothetical protein